jgi:hypothetical protein
MICNSNRVDEKTFGGNISNLNRCKGVETGFIFKVCKFLKLVMIWVYIYILTFVWIGLFSGRGSLI